MLYFLEPLVLEVPESLTGGEQKPNLLSIIKFVDLGWKPMPRIGFWNKDAKGVSWFKMDDGDNDKPKLGHTIAMLHALIHGRHEHLLRILEKARLFNDSKHQHSEPLEIPNELYESAKATWQQYLTWYGSTKPSISGSSEFQSCIEEWLGMYETDQAQRRKKSRTPKTHNIQVSSESDSDLDNGIGICKTDLSQKAFDAYFDGSKRSIDSEPKLTKLHGFSRYGRGKQFKFCGTFKFRKTDAVSPNTTECKRWIKYSALVLNPQYRELLVNKYKWDIKIEQSLYDSDVEALEHSSDDDEDDNGDPKSKQSRQVPIRPMLASQRAIKNLES